jgi:hypothetical protein
MDTADRKTAYADAVRTGRVLISTARAKFSGDALIAELAKAEIYVEARLDHIDGGITMSDRIVNKQLKITRSIQRKTDSILMDAKRSNDLGLQQRASEIMALCDMLMPKMQNEVDLAEAMKIDRDWPTEQEIASISQICMNAPKGK